MIQALSIFCLLLLLLPLWLRLRRDFISGLAYAVFLCVSMSTFLRIPMPGALPQLTIFRLVLITLFVFWLRERRSGRTASLAPLGRCFLFWGLANFVSLLFTSVDPVTSLKRYLDFVIEIWGFWFIVGTSIRQREHGQQILHAAVIGVGVVALMAFVERYTGFNPVRFIVPMEGEEGPVRDVVATYQHRILLGTGMAMAWPLAFALLEQKADRRWRFRIWAVVALMLATCYFAQSRGPWIATALAGCVLFALGGWTVRRRLIWLPLLAVLVLASRPGVWTTLVGSAKVTADRDSFKGGTFLYRLELWQVAWTQVSKSPIRTFFGYGPGCGLESDVQWDLSYRDVSSEIWSWDNHYAYELYQSGILGLTALLTLYFVVAKRVLWLYRAAHSTDQQMLAALLASLVAMLFMMSNVLIFAKQLNFLFWSVAAVGLSYRFPAYAVEEQSPSLADDMEQVHGTATKLAHG